MKLSLVITLVAIPRGSNINDKTTHLQAREGYELERQKNGDVTIARDGKVLGVIGHANVAYCEALPEPKEKAV